MSEVRQDAEIGPQVMEDFEVLQRAKSNLEDFRPLYEKYFKPVFLFVLRKISDKELTADITSQVFLKAMSKLDQFEFRGAPFQAWLYRIAINECTDYFRKSKRYRFVAVDETSFETLHQELTNEDTAYRLQNDLPILLESLSPDELHLIELRYFEARPFKEVAEILGLTEANTKVRTYRTLDKMRKHFLKRRSK